VILESSEGMNTYIHFLHLQCLSYILKKYIEKYIAMPTSVHESVHAVMYASWNVAILLQTTSCVYVNHQVYMYMYVCVCVLCVCVCV
jgi:hypothetical protein